MNTRTTPAAATTPTLDLRKLFKDVDIPEAGRRIFEAQRKDLEALVQANRQAFQALQALGKRQQEILQAAATAWKEGVKDVIAAPKLSDKASVATRNSRQAFAQALEDLKELATLAVASNRKAVGVLGQRVKERVADVTPRRLRAAVEVAPPAPAKRAARTSAKRRTAPARRRPAA
jgi:phasin family protein